MRLLTSFLFLVVIVAANLILGSGRVQTLIILSPLVTVLALTVVLSARQVGFKNTVIGFSLMVSLRYQDVAEAKTFADTVGRSALLSSHITALLAVIKATANLTNPSAIGASAALFLLGYLYGLVLFALTRQR